MSKTGGADWQDKLGPQDTVTFEEPSQFILELVPAKDKLVMCYDAEIRANEGEGAEPLTMKWPKYLKKRIKDSCAGSLSVAAASLIEAQLDYLEKQKQTLVVHNRVQKR